MTLRMLRAQGDFLFPLLPTEFHGDVVSVIKSGSGTNVHVTPAPPAVWVASITAALAEQSGIFETDGAPGIDVVVCVLCLEHESFGLLGGYGRGHIRHADTVCPQGRESRGQIVQ